MLPGTPLWSGYLLALLLGLGETASNLMISHYSCQISSLCFAWIVLHLVEFSSWVLIMCHLYNKSHFINALVYTIQESWHDKKITYNIHTAMYLYKMKLQQNSVNARQHTNIKRNKIMGKKTKNRKWWSATRLTTLNTSDGGIITTTNIYNNKYLQ